MFPHNPIYLLDPGVADPLHVILKQQNQNLAPFPFPPRNLFPDNLIVAMFQQTQTVYTEETVTSWSKCLAQNNETFTNCSAAVETVESLDLDCSNATRTERQVGLGNREGTNVLGIIVFTVVFSVFLSRQGERGRPVVEAIATLNEVIMSIVRLVMW